MIARLLILPLAVLLCSAAALADEAKTLPAPYATKSVIKHPQVIGWPEGKRPQAPKGFRVEAFTRELENPRWIYLLPNGDVLIAQSRTLPKDEDKEEAEKTAKEKKAAEGMKKSKTVTGTSPNKITLLRDADNDGRPEKAETFLQDLHQPFGMAVVGDALYVAATDALWKFPYTSGQTRIDEDGVNILDLPAGGYNNHWTRNVVAAKDGAKLYVSVGSASNVAEHGTAEETLRANILEVDLDGGNLRVFANGLRNPVGLAFEPVTQKLWTAVNERDELGDELVPDYLTSVRSGGFYGWPYSYWGANEDPRWKGKRPDLVKKALVPDVNLGAHTASLGLAFYTGKAFPQKYRGGAFVGQRGSWNRSQFAGYRVAFVPFVDGEPSGPPEDFLTGFIADEDRVYGRPVGVAIAADGSLLVCDEPGNVVWRVSAE